MQRKILIIYDERASWGAARNTARISPIGFEWFTALINSEHDHKIWILVVDYERPWITSSSWNPDKFNQFFFDRVLGHIVEFKEYRELRDAGVDVFFSDDVFRDFSEDIQELMKRLLKERGIVLVDSREFFINAVNDGFEIYF